MFSSSLQLFNVVEKKEFTEDMNEPTAFTGMVYDSNEPSERVRSPDEGWEELKSQEMHVALFTK